MNATLRRIVVSGAATVALAGAATTTATAATHEHEATVVAIASDTGDTSGITPAVGQQPAIYNQQIQASSGAIGAGVVAILLFGTIVFFRVKGHHLKVGDAVVVMFLGVALAGTVIGGMADQITDSGVASLSNVLGGL